MAKLGYHVLCRVGSQHWFWEKPWEEEAALEHTEGPRVSVMGRELEQESDRGSGLGSDLAPSLWFPGAGPSRNSRPGNARASRPSVIAPGSSIRKAEF